MCIWGRSTALALALVAGCIERVPAVPHGSDAGSVGDAGVVTDAGALVDAGPTPADVRVRVVAANLTSENVQSWDPGHGKRILQGIQPDIALLQELNVGDGSAAALRSFVDEAFGPGFSVFRESTSGIPNGIVSRWPILEAGAWDDSHTTNRELAYARVDLPGPADLWAVSVHLLTANATTRDEQVGELLEYLTAFVDDADLLVVGGDFNTNSASESGLASLDAVLSLAHRPVDQAGEDGTNAPRNRPYDWIIVNDQLDAAHVPVVIGENVFPDGLVVDTRVYQPIADLAPARLEDSAAPSMQHMAVVKDFLIPAP